MAGELGLDNLHGLGAEGDAVALSGLHAFGWNIPYGLFGIIFTALHPQHFRGARRGEDQILKHAGGGTLVLTQLRHEARELYIRECWVRNYSVWLPWEQYA